MDIENMSPEELKGLRQTLDGAIADAEKRRRAEALDAATQAAAGFGYTLAELLPREGARRGKAVSNTLYADPQDRSATWNGRGRRPNWIKRALEGGHSLESLRVSRT